MLMAAHVAVRSTPGIRTKIIRLRLLVVAGWDDDEDEPE